MSRDDLWIAAKFAAASVAAAWGSMGPLMHVLLWAMTIDIVTGVIAGYVTRSLSSDVNGRGIAKKAMVLMLVVLAAIVENEYPSVVGIPLEEAVAGWFIGREVLSIFENAARADIKPPDFLRDAFSRLAQSPQGKPSEERKS